MKKHYAIVLFLLNILPGVAQEKTTPPIKDLRTQLRNTTADTSKVAVLQEIGTFYLERSTEIAYPYAIDSARHYADAAFSLASAIQSKSGMGKSYILISKIHALDHDAKEARSAAQQAIRIFENIGSKRGQAKAYMALAAAGGYGNVEEATRNTSLALERYKEAGDLRGQADALAALGYLNMMGNKMEEGRSLLFGSLDIYKKIGYTNVQRLYALIAINFHQFGLEKDALENGLEAVRLIEAKNDSSADAAEAYNYVAIIYDAMHEEQKSFEYLQKADRIAEKHDNLPLVIMLETNIVQMLMKFKRYKEALVYLKKLEALPGQKGREALMLNQRCILVYTALKDFGNAKKYVDRAMEISDKTPPEAPEQFMLYPGIVKYHLETQQYEVARKYAARYRVMAEKSKNAGRLADIHRILFLLDSAQLRFNDAVKELKLAKDYEYKILDTKKEKAFQELQVKYESDKKNRQLLLKENNIQLLRKQGELQHARLSQANLLKNIGFVGVALLILILSLVYRSFYNKQKTNRLLESQKRQIDEKNIGLQKLADEREWLLREIHHRVKNNLQIVMSLLSTQSHYLTDEAAMQAINSSQHRIHSMSLIHKKLYKSDNLVSINMPTYINELIEYFRVCFDTGQRIRFHLEVANIDLDISQAVPVGLLLNETVTNAIKHAFPEPREGIIRIAMRHHEGNRCELCISDNGIGLQFKSKMEDTLGMRLIQGLTTDIDGEMETFSEDGYAIKISFPLSVSPLASDEESRSVPA